MRLLNNIYSRLKQKTYLFSLISSLTKNYNLSLKAAHLLAEEFIHAYTQDNPKNLLDGQLLYTAIHKDEPAGKPLSSCKKVKIKLTLLSHHFINMSPTQRTRELVYSLSYQALAQSALLSTEDLAFILNVSPRTIARIYKEYQEKGLYLPTRGNYHSFGAGQTHKGEALKLFFAGKQVSEIAFLLHHSIESIERYINDFAKVVVGIKNEFSIKKIAKITKITVKVIKEYVEIYERYKEDEERMAFLTKRVELLEKKSEYGRSFYGKIKQKCEKN